MADLNDKQAELEMLQRWRDDAAVFGVLWRIPSDGRTPRAMKMSSIEEATGMESWAVHAAIDRLCECSRVGEHQADFMDPYYEVIR